MSKRDDGGPAFPVPETDSCMGHDGMRWLDYAAIQIAAGDISAEIEFRRTHGDEDEDFDPVWFAGHAYSVADALLVEKRKREAGDG